MIKGIGIDLQPIGRMEVLLARYDRDTLSLVFTSSELERGLAEKTSARYLAVCFAVKEAMGKALGTGLATIGWNEIEAEVQPGRLGITLAGKAYRLAQSLAVTAWAASWSSWEGHVLVTVVLE